MTRPRVRDRRRSAPHRRVLGALLTAALLAAPGCAEERPPINQVQPNAMDKAMFQGTEWYMLQTVIDTPAQTTASFVGDSSSLEKIVWDIQEKYLIARQKRQNITGIENGAIAGDGTVKTGIVAIYAIDSHFDIRRQYNTTTGEELNIIQENTTDRPWYERRNFRVDWSKNLIDNPGLAVENSFAGVNLQPINYQVQAPDPMAPVFEENEDGDVYYFDIVNKYIASPEVVTFTSGQQILECNLTFGSGAPCTPGEIAVRNSFLRAEPDRDYEPMVYTNDHMERAGYFLTTRDEYSPDYGVLSGQRLRLVNRHNVWKQSHQRDQSGAFVTCSADADCEPYGPASRCDRTIARAKQLSAGQCTIPYREREVRPTAYYVSESFPADLFPDAQAFVSGWNDALKNTIGSMRRIECEQTDASACASELTRTDADSSFILCHNPVADGDHEACGEPGLVVRVGDVRYNLIGWIPEVTKGPLGFGPSFADPETGEIVSAAAYVYGAEVVRLSAYARDLLAMVNGDLSENEVMDNGAYADWINRVRSGTSFSPTAREADSHVVPVDGADADSINRAMSFDWQNALVRESGPPPAPLTHANAFQALEAAKARVIDAVGELHLGDQARAAERLLRGTDIERLMVTDEMRLAAGLSPLDVTSDSDMPVASPLSGMSLDHFRELDLLKRQRRNRPNSCLVDAEFVDDGLLGLVREIDRSAHEGDGTIDWYGMSYDIASRDSRGNPTGIDYDLVADMLRHPIFNAVTAHEVGHTLGLRHNFSGSFDSLNYHPKYWELRNDGKMEPRAFGDPMTQDEIDGRIREYQYSTVMDYGNNFVVTDANGIGHYDRAAIKLGYGNLVEVFDVAIPDDEKALVAQIGALQRFGYPGGIDLIHYNPDPTAKDGTLLRSVPYTEMPEHIGGVENLEKRADVPFSSLRPASALQDIGVNLPVYSSDGRLAVPYRYCGDEFTDYEPSCLRYDAGADEYETLTSIVDTYWNYYLLNNFQRQRVGFDPSTVPGNIYSRYFAKLEDSNLYYSLYRGVLTYAYGADPGFFERKDGFGGYTAGIGASYGLLTRVLATPEPGCHRRERDAQGNALLVAADSYYCRAEPTSMSIDSFDGRNLRTGYSLGPDSSFWFLTRAGYFQDKVLALQLLTDPGARVLGYDTNADIRRYQVSFYTTFQDPIQEVLRGIGSRDWTPYAARQQWKDLVFPTPSEQVRGDAPGTPVDPDVSFALEIYSLVFGMAYLPRTFDYRFIDRGRIFVKGAGESVALADGLPTVEFLDPESGLTYVAPSYPDANGQETGVGASVLLYAKELEDSGADATLAAWMANVNVLRRLTYVMGFGGSDRQYL